MHAPRRKPGTTAEYKAFADVLRKVLQVSHSELQTRLEAEKGTKKRRRKSTETSADREAHDEDQKASS
jgi:hypothetical protein